MRRGNSPHFFYFWGKEELNMAKANVQVGEVKVGEKTIEEQTQERFERILEFICN